MYFISDILASLDKYLPPQKKDRRHKWGKYQLLVRSFGLEKVKSVPRRISLLFLFFYLLFASPFGRNVNEELFYWLNENRKQFIKESQLYISYWLFSSLIVAGLLNYDAKHCGEGTREGRAAAPSKKVRRRQECELRSRSAWTPLPLPKAEHLPKHLHNTYSQLQLFSTKADGNLARLVLSYLVILTWVYLSLWLHQQNAAIKYCVRAVAWILNIHSCNTCT